MLVNFILTDFFEGLDLERDFGPLSRFFRRRNTNVSVSVIKNGKDGKEWFGRSVADKLRKPESKYGKGPATASF